MHEHLDQFGIINMNGRVYDPLTAMFFSPDPFVQAPGNWLSYNRYSYVHNNPFRYVDPDWNNPLLIAAGIYLLFFTDTGYDIQKYLVTTHHLAPTTGRLDSISRNGEITSYSYDTQNRVSSIEITGQHKQIFSYDDFDRVTTLREETGNRAFERKITKFGFDSKGLPTGIKASGIVNLNYDFGNNGNLNYRVDSIMGQKEELVYDGMNRLTNWDIYQNNVLVKQNSMVYNPNTGTITTKSDLDNLTMLYGDNGKPHALTGISGVPSNFPTDSLRVTYTDFKKIKTLTEGNNYYILTYGIDDQRRKSEYKINCLHMEKKQEI
jgi:RHS repeat-associated protein